MSCEISYYIHMVPASGGYTSDGKWKDSRGNFFLPAKVLSKLFRGKFLHGCRELYANGEIKYNSKNIKDSSLKTFNDLIDICYKKDWVVYAKVPFGGAEGTFEYLGRYTHRIAISNSRIIDVNDTHTTFSWKDYKDNSTKKEMTVTNEEFIRRFLLHVLPSGFTRIRHYGLYSSRSKSKRLELYCKAIAVKHKKRPKKKKKVKSPIEILCKILGRDPRYCPVCGSLLKQVGLGRASPA